MNMQDNLNTDVPGFIVKLEAPLLKAEDFEIVNEMLRMAFLFTADLPEPMVREQTMNLPYGQGPGYLRLWQAQYTFDPEDDPERAQDEAALHTGWYVEFGYSDSFTSTFTSPVFYADPSLHTKFMVKEY